MSNWVASARDVCAALGLAVVVGLLGYVLGSAHARDVYAAQLAATDSLALAHARSDSATYATTKGRLDSVLAAWDAAVTVPAPAARVVHDTVRAPSRDTATVFLGMAQYGPGSDPATLQFTIDSLRRAGTAVVTACRALERDCDQVRHDRDALAIGLARATAALTAPPSWWSHWRVTLGAGCAVSLAGRPACGPAIAAGWSW